MGFNSGFKGLNSICHLVALLGAHLIFHVSSIRVNSCMYCRWEDNIKMDLQEVGGGRGDWIELAQDRDRWRALVGMVRDFRVP
jgi:hypothetical protein